MPHLPDLSSLLLEMGLPPVSDFDTLPRRSAHGSTATAGAAAATVAGVAAIVNNGDDDADGEVAAFTKYFGGVTDSTATIW